MKTKEEIEQLAEIHANLEMEVYKSMDLPKGTKQAIFTHCLVSYNIAYTQCQEDMADDLEAILNNSIYVDFISKKEIVKYLKSLNKQKNE
jgi:hypothetical protein